MVLNFVLNTLSLRNLLPECFFKDDHSLKAEPHPLQGYGRRPRNHKIILQKKKQIGDWEICIR